MPKKNGGFSRKIECCFLLEEISGLVYAWDVMVYIYVYYIPNFWEGGEVGKRGKGVYDTWHMKYYEIVYSQLLGRAKYEGVYSGGSMSQLVQGTWRVDW